MTAIIGSERTISARPRWVRAGGHDDDVLGRIREMTDPLQRVTRMEWDAFGRLSQVVDEAGNATHYAWDLQDQLLSVWEGPVNGADTLASFYTYTQLGQLTRHTQR
ncbi:MAG: hypothetical protein EA398_11900, partial [Deltaproteobacteria bacterium]